VLGSLIASPGRRRNERFFSFGLTEFAAAFSEADGFVVIASGIGD
jgi:hypothetical protein